MAANNNVDCQPYKLIVPRCLLQEDKLISKDTRSQHTKGDKLIKGTKTPLPPPRLPIALPKKYQPLPPEPESSRSLFPQRHTFPEAWRGPKKMNLKDLSEKIQRYL
ncbi:cytokine-dependent hematopoietic cell linker-like [Trichechus manatus latirostris]|uniref:Cytokine-dependent hematopoietic cell linker-like n=1 Tax=Trichechus manatus latirostris TaxID=127582 RepID=A0A2Y9RND5_TRIMA|nr:cytokine-dependent hematopoietic cell linker-like [Trichechus manatus latirostris]